MSDQRPLHLAVALDGAGWHPAAWREPAARPQDLFTARYWTDTVQQAERGLLDFVTIEDSLALQTDDPGTPDRRRDQVRGRLDAVLVASRVAPRTRHIGLIPTTSVTHTEPFHVSKAIATLDFVSTGRAGWRPQIATDPRETAHFGRRTLPVIDRGDPDPAALADLFTEAGDAVEVVRRLWDSWEDDAEIRDAATGRFIDRDKLHYIDFEGRFFNVKGPSIVPRPPQGQPVVAALAHAAPAYAFAARHTDVVFVTPRTSSEITGIVDHLSVERSTRDVPPLRVLADLVVFLGETTAQAQHRRSRLDERDGVEYRSDAAIFVGTRIDLADQLAEWHAAGVDGFRLRPAAVPDDLDAITNGLVPELQRRGLFRTAYDTHSLRERLHLDRPANRYAAATLVTQGATS